ncbi:MAG: hypothetical protein WC667_05870 [Sulfurimonas sp.]|jgi:flagellar motor switch protein FliG
MTLNQEFLHIIVLFNSAIDTGRQNITSVLKRYKVNDMNYFSYLEDVAPKNLFEALQTEQLQTIAIVLVYIDRDLAANTLNMFPDDMKAQIAIKMAHIDELSEVAVKSIANILETKILPSGVKLGGVKAVAEILKRLKD